MRAHRLLVASIVLSAGLLVACGSDKPASGGRSTDAVGPSTSSAAASSTQPAPSGKVDCDGLRLTLADLNVNWQVVIGLTNSPTSEWTNLPIGTLPKFGDQIASAKLALGSDAEAASSLDYMSGANDIVQRGIGGDTKAQADLASYLGSDVTASVGKQLPISMAFTKVGC
jgi:hypothetical protein